MVLAGLPAEVASFPLFSLMSPINDEQQATSEVHAQMAIIVLRSMS